MKPKRILKLALPLFFLAGTVGAQTVFTSGVLRHQYWTSANPNGVSSPSRTQVEAGQAGLPTTDTTDLDIWDTNLGGAVNYVERVSGLFIAPITTNYVFWVNSDDDSDLFVSTDATPANKRLVAQEAGWSNVDQWHAAGSGGGSTGAQKRSDQWSPDGGTTHPFSKGIAMVAGQKYWVEGVHHQGGGGENFAATYSYLGGSQPVDGQPSAISASNNVIGYGYTIPATLTVTAQATNTSAWVGREATFTYVVADPIPDPLVYQWYRNGTIISNATFEQYTILAQPGDNNAMFQCIVSLPTNYNSSVTSTSSVAKLTVNTGSVTYTNGLKVELILGAVRTDAENGNTGPASAITVTQPTGFEVPVNDGINNYVQRITGWFIPPASGNYVFFVCSDDDSDLFLSTDATPANKQLIAQESGWSASRQWTNSAGGSVVSQKRSDQWTNGLGVSPYSSGIALTAGTPYYIEADHHQGGGGDNVAVLAKLATDPDPTNNAPPIPPNELALITSPTTNITFVTKPKNVTVFEGGQPLLTGSAQSDSEFSVLYQWQRSGTNIPGATLSSYSFTTTIADNGTVFDLVAYTAEGGLSITSSPPVTLTVQAAVLEPGLALMQYWINQTAGSPEGSPPVAGTTPNFQMAVPAFEAGVNNENGDQYVNEVNGFFIPATTGTYDFICTGDDFVDLFLSTDANPNNKRLICQQVGWSNQLTWSTDNGGGADLPQKHSATWTNAQGGAPFANGINLTAGTKYYIEMWHHEGTGGDSCAATFTIRAGGVIAPDPADGTDSAITGKLLAFNAPAASYVKFTQQPTNETAISGTTATFTALGVSDGNIPIGTTGLFEKTGATQGATNFIVFPNVLFQWYKNGTLIPGATQSAYITPQLLPADNNAQFVVQIRALGIANWSNSSPAVLTVITDTNKPTAYAAVFDEEGLPVISVSFSKYMNLSTITNMANYMVSGGGASIIQIIVDTNDVRHVQLQLAAEPTGPVTLTLSGITDFSGNTPTTTTLSVATVPLINADIGDPQTPDPAWPGYMYVDGAAAYTVETQGSDIWNAGDGFNFSYESKTNDFDVVVRQISFTKVSNWSKGGLMVREDLTPGSRNMSLVNDPTSADGVGSIDGSGNGANVVESNARTTNSSASYGFANSGTNPPAYPNAWVRMKRTGQLIQTFYGSDGANWTRLAGYDFSTNANGPLPANVYVGIACSAHNNNSVTATVLNYYYTGSFANYNSAYIAPTNAPRATLTGTVTGGNIVISWTPTGGTLQSTTALGPNATWTPVGTANPSAPIAISGSSSKFFRVGP